MRCDQVEDKHHHAGYRQQFDAVPGQLGYRPARRFQRGGAARAGGVGVDKNAFLAEQLQFLYAFKRLTGNLELHAPGLVGLVAQAAEFSEDETIQQQVAAAQRGGRQGGDMHIHGDQQGDDEKRYDRTGDDLNTGQNKSADKAIGFVAHSSLQLECVP